MKRIQIARMEFHFGTNQDIFKDELEVEFNDSFFTNCASVFAFYCDDCEDGRLIQPLHLNGKYECVLCGQIYEH